MSGLAGMLGLVIMARAPHIFPVSPLSSHCAVESTAILNRLSLCTLDLFLRWLAPSVRYYRIPRALARAGGENDDSSPSTYG